MPDEIDFSGVTPEDINRFCTAIRYDEGGLFGEWDKELWALLKWSEETGPIPEIGGDQRARDGHIIQDLRLDLKAYQFAMWVYKNQTSNSSLAAYWLRANLGANPISPFGP